MKIGRLARPFACTATAALMLASSPAVAFAQSHDDHSAAVASERHRPNPKENELVQAVRQATDKFHDPDNAKSEGYSLVFGCVSGGDFGAMGLHFLKSARPGEPDPVFDGEIDVATPEIVLYEALPPSREFPNGRLQLTGADYLVPVAEWHKKHPAPPELMGQLFHRFDEPNRFGLPAFYTLHVWAWKDNPNGTFTNWNPAVSCDAFNPQVIQEPNH
jgi:hypothetical protein